MKQPEDTLTLELPLPAPEPRDLGHVHNDAADAAAGDMFVPAPSWRRALDAAIATDPAGKQGVAARLGVSRPYVSRVTTGHIPVAPQRFIDRVAAVYLQVDCPHLQRSLPPADCQAFAAREYARIAAADVPHWRACRRCPSNPVQRRAVAASTTANTATGSPS